MPIFRKPVVIIIVLLIAATAVYLVFFKGSVAAPADNKKNAAAVKTNPTAKTENNPVDPPTFNKQQYSLSDPTSIWVVVNKARPLQPTTYAPADLTDIGGGYSLRAEAAKQFLLMQSAAKDEGLNIKPLSSYRSYSTQVSTYNGWVQRLGQEQADRESARPGYSEHQTGLALDIGGGGCGIEPCFGNTAEGKWVDANAYKYGYLLRYYQSKMPVTGYQSEPWHFRYIGTDLAAEMHTKNVLTLEEFFDLPAAPTYL